MAHQPQNLVATPVSTSEIQLSWDDVGTLVDETYEIERDGLTIEPNYAGTTYSDTGLDQNTEYTYRVRAVAGVIPEPVTPPASAVAARVSIFVPVVVAERYAEVTPSTIAAVVSVITPSIALSVGPVVTTVAGTTTIPTPAISVGASPTVTPTTVVASVSVLTPSLEAGYFDSYAGAYGEEAVEEFSPADITGLVAWYDFGDVSTLFQDTARTTAITTDAQVIKGVTDKSGNGNHLSEATNGPTYKVSIVNGNSIARTDGSNDRLASGTLSTALVQPYTVFLSLKYNDISVVNKVAIDGDASGRGVALLCNANSAPNKWGVFFGTGISASSVTNDTSHHVFQTTANGTSSALRIDGGANTLGAPVGTNTVDTLAFAGDFLTGGSAYSNIDYLQVIVYTGNVSNADKDLIGQYLATDAGTTWTAVS